jgi:acetone carboxylase gamma subunit
MCGEELCAGGEDWKDAVPQAHAGLSSGGPHRPDSSELFLRQFFCPGCGTLLDTEVARSTDPPLHDRVALPVAAEAART